MNVPAGSTLVSTGVYWTPSGEWFARVTLTRGGFMLQDIGRTFPGYWSRGEVEAVREIMRDEVRTELDREPEYVEVIDRDGQVIWGIKRNQVVRPRVTDRRIVPSPPPRRADLEAFFEEARSSREDTLRLLFNEEPDGPGLEPHVGELLTVVGLLVEELEIVVHTDTRRELIERARAALEPFQDLSID